MHDLWYVLAEDGETPIAVDDFDTYVRWRSEHPPTLPPAAVGKTKVGEVEVSTVFLCHDHNWSGGQPILFETMVFGGEWDQSQWRYHTRAQALAAHDQIVAALRAGHDPNAAVP